MVVELRKLQFQSSHLPSQIDLVLADAEIEEESQVWISARFPLGKLDTDRLPLLAREALLELQRLVDQGMANASKEPGAPTH